jgi:uncharacterized membrane protein
MANSKARPARRPAAAANGRSAEAAARAARTRAAVRATPTSRPVSRPAAGDIDLELAAGDDGLYPDGMYDEPEAAPRTGPPLWLQWVSFVLAVLGLAISAYETYAHFNGSHLAGCSIKAGSTFDCTAVITSPQSMVFGVIPVAILGLAFYVAAVPMFSPWAWRIQSRLLNQARLGSLVVGMGFVIYLIYAELFQIGQACEYCSGVHAVTFLLFCITVFSAAIWGLGQGKTQRRGPAAAA